MPRIGSKAHAELKSARRRVLAGYPVEKPFATQAAARRYLSGKTIACLLCGRVFKALLRHLITIHGCSDEEYKDKYHLPYRVGLVSTPTRGLLHDLGVRRIPDLLAGQEACKPARDAGIRSQRTSEFKRARARENVAKSPRTQSPFSEDDVREVLRFMFDHDASLSSAIRLTAVMSLTTFSEMLKRHPCLVSEYEEARSRVSRGATNPLIYNKTVVEKIRLLRKAGVPRKVIAEKFNVHVKYVALLARGYRHKKPLEEGK